nr:MAG: ORF1 [Torque teno midi virus]
MPFWWKRRRKPWYGRWGYRRRFQKRKQNRRRRRRRFTRRRSGRTYRRRRKHKVRRKKKKIVIQQWQPESITKCKIIGYSTLVLGAQGTQFLCWTNEMLEYTQPKAPGGGGFGSEVITLEWLYNQYVAHNNIWTRSNKNKDLARYTGAVIKLFRHPTTDFVFSYSLSPPFDLTKYTYTDMQPQNLLLRPHKRIIYSKLSKPWGKQYVKVKIKPPKLMSTKWFFQSQIAETPLVLLQAAAASFRFPRIGPKAQNQMLTLYYLDTTFYTHCNWAQTSDQKYMPAEQTANYTIKYKTKTGESEISLPGNIITTYAQSIHRDTGWFRPEVLNAIEIKKNGIKYGNRPIYIGRYNPNDDEGPGNEVYAVSVLQSKYSPPSFQTDLLIANQPLWMAFYGFYSFLKQTLKDKFFTEHYMFIVKSSAIKPVGTSVTQTFYPLLDFDFVQGKLPWEEYLSEQIKNFWYPKALFQQQTINSIVECGPYIPRYSNIPDSTWELQYNYKLFFKWGGPQALDQPVDDPKDKHDYPTPSNHSQAIQIGNPAKQTPESILHNWDFRRGIVTQTALKRMSENIQTDTTFDPDDTESPKKKRRKTKEMPLPQEKEKELKTCLLSLCEENTCQETPENIQQLIQQQQQQQQQLKHNILQLMTHLKKQQRYLGMQTGILE